MEIYQWSHMRHNFAIQSTIHLGFLRIFVFSAVVFAASLHLRCSCWLKNRCHKWCKIRFCAYNWLTDSFFFLVVCRLIALSISLPLLVQKIVYTKIVYSGSFLIPTHPKTFFSFLSVYHFLRTMYICAFFFRSVYLFIVLVLHDQNARNAHAHWNGRYRAQHSTAEQSRKRSKTRNITKLSEMCCIVFIQSGGVCWCVRYASVFLFF